jgi:hypothetical protein
LEAPVAMRRAEVLRGKAKLSESAVALAATRAWIEVPLAAIDGPAPMRDHLAWLVLMRDGHDGHELAIDDETGKLLRVRAL